MSLFPILATITNKCRKDANLVRVSNGPVMVGGYIPQCDENGDYKPLQIHASTGMRWCVDPKTGKEIENTRVSPSDNDPNCTAGNCGRIFFHQLVSYCLPLCTS